jgi:hypothetical protein
MEYKMRRPWILSQSLSEWEGVHMLPKLCKVSFLTFKNENSIILGLLLENIKQYMWKCPINYKEVNITHCLFLL